MGLALVTLMAKKGWRLKSRAKWRKAVNSQNRGRVGYRADRRPPLFGPEKPPHEGKRIYHYYCNKIYKVIRFSAATEVAPASASQMGSDWIQQKFAAWFPTRVPGFSGKMASALCFSMCALLFCYRLLGSKSSTHAIHGSPPAMRSSNVALHVQRHALLLLSLLAAIAGSTNIRRQNSETLCEQAEEEPLLSCSKVAARQRHEAWNMKLEEAWQNLCKDDRNLPLMEVYLDRRFRTNYKSVYNTDGWADAAWVNYVAVPADGKGIFGQLTERLVDSVHRFSQHPVIVVNFGTKAPEDLDPTRFPSLVLLHARGLRPTSPISFNFNKLRAVLLAQVKVGASLDSDMLMVTAQADRLLNRTAEEITEKYPYPMMPTHFLDRDVRDREAARTSHKGNFLGFTCKDCPTPTMRWGQAQPTWTYWSLPFLSRWLSAKIAGRKEQGVPTSYIKEDEDLLNVALWQEGATKAWCAFQTGGINFLWENLDAQHPPGPYPYYDDSRYFPKGVPVAFFFGHAEKDPAHIDKALAYLADPDRVAQPAPNPFFHDMKFFSDFEQIRKDYPDLKCTL
ncbi:unnamed protein product [Symbiodinium sp. CCMP2456]|nr:unnamed protein product [Symbiodinium sp. CCMP2456]